MRQIIISSIVLAVAFMPTAYGVSYSNSGTEKPADLIPATPSTAPAAAALHSQRSEPAEPLVMGPPEKRFAIVPVLLHDVNSKKNRAFLLTESGEIIGDDISAIEDFFRCKRSRRRHPIAPEILAVLAEISSAYPGHVIEVVSAYRKRGFGVKGSKHFSGRAIDLRVRGVRTSELRDFLWTGQEQGRGIGHYHHENFVHVDHRPNEDKIGWNQGRRNSSYRYNPRWARG